MVFVSSLLTVALTAATFAGFAAAHADPAPGSPELTKRAIFQTSARGSLANCQAELSKRGGIYERARARRENYADSLRKARGIRSGAGIPYKVKRDIDDVLNTDHHSNLTGVTNNTDPAILFDDISSCVLAPEVTEGPFYVSGEYVRWDLREDQVGLDTYIDVQLIDVSTCEPVSDVYLDFWHANATGVYGGVIGGGNGDTSDESNLNNTWLRGIQKTDEDGVSQWLSIFPGHYTGRTTHIHVIAHQDGAVFDNGTYAVGTVSHVGQLFFDQSLITTVEATSPYVLNTQQLTTNVADGIMAQQASDIDPVLHYVLLGDTVEDGLMLWSSIGIDTTVARTVFAAATLTEDGGVLNEGAGGPPPGGPPGGPGGPPPV